MTKIAFIGAAVAFAVSFGSICAAFAGQTVPEGQTRVQGCNAAWKAEKAKPDYVKPAKGEGRAAYSKFRSACIAQYDKPARKSAKKAD